MRETRKSNNLSQPQVVNDKKIDVLRQAVEQEYTKLYRQGHKTTQKTVRHAFHHVAPHPRPCPLTIPIPNSSIESTINHDDNDRTISVIISDGANQKSQKKSTIVTIMPALSSIRELISYVPTMKNLATRGDLTGIPYLGDTFNYEDQQLINSISGEIIKPNKNSIRKKKLDEQSLELLYQSIRSNQAWNTYSNDQIIDEILHYHRDSTPRIRLITFANQNQLPSNDNHRPNTNIDKYDTVNVDIDDLIIKPWCSRFCSRCYTYYCLLHKEKPSHLPLPKQFNVSNTDQSSPPCGSACYKHEREHLKRSLSPSYPNHQQNNLSISSESNENVKKRRRKSTLHHENLPTDVHPPKKPLLTRIENHMINPFSIQALLSLPEENLLANNWTLTNRSLFRLFYFLFDGDLCSLNNLFNNHCTCKELYQEFISDTKYFSERISSINGLTFRIRQPYRRRMLEGATRAFLFHIKKHLNSNNNHKLKSAYQPCLHDGPCTLTNPDCYCIQNGTYCEKYCNCSIDCPHRFPGCACKGACLLNNCLCCAEGRECDPDLCHKCGASTFHNPIENFNTIIKTEPEIPMTMIEERKSFPSLSRRNTRTKINENISTRQHSLRSCRIVEPSYKTVRNQTKRSNSSSIPTTFPMITCANISLQRKLYKQILIAESDVAGYGAFLGSPIAYPGDLIAEYTGEIISEEEADRRGRLYDKQACSYLFNLDTKRCVDARQFGNKIRFANHSSKPNCVPKIKLVNGKSLDYSSSISFAFSKGDYRIGIYAKQVIFQGDELFFEYMYDAHQRQQFVNNERIDETEQDGLIILKRYAENFILVRPTYD